MSQLPEYPPEIQKWFEGQILLVDKPYGWSSFDLVRKVRFILKHRAGIKKIKVGHAGTLDPLASGLMIICTGRATKKLVDFQDYGKEYVAQIELGATTPSFDLETEVDQRYPTAHITRDLIEDYLKESVGPQLQMPPQFSAKWVDGKRAYDLARKGKKADIKPQSIVLKELELTHFELPQIHVRVACSKGTYIRSFANDLGLGINSGAHLIGLKRTKIGPYLLEDAQSVEDLENIFQQT